MRAGFVLVVLLLVVGGAGAGTAKTDKWVPAGIAFWDESRGLGWFHVARSSDDRPVLARTEDGGRTWRVVRRPRSVSGITVSRTTANEAWLAEGGCDYWPRCRPRLLRSADGGLSWQPVGKAVLAMTFPTATDGFGALYDRKERWTLLRTRDGGDSWSPFRSPCRYYNNVAWFETPREGWTLCQDIAGAGQAIKGVFRTRDGGRSWRLVMSAAWRLGPSTRGAITTAGYAQGIAFAGGRGWLWQTRNGSYTSSDGGSKWTPIAFTHLPATSLELIEIDDVAPVTRDVAFALVNRNWTRRELRRTDDGGRTWEIVRVWRYD
jgi:hypothetical protein